MEGMEGKDNMDDPTIMPMICMVDKKSRVFPPPQVYISIDMCKRELVHAAKYGKDVNGRPPLFAEYPQDFKLVVVGFFDSRTGAIMPQSATIAEVSDVLSEK